MEHLESRALVFLRAATRFWTALADDRCTRCTLAKSRRSPVIYRFVVQRKPLSSRSNKEDRGSPAIHFPARCLRRISDGFNIRVTSRLTF